MHTIINCSFRAGPALLFTQFDDDITIDGFSVFGCHAKEGGAAVIDAVETTTPISIMNMIFEKNSANSGGAIHILSGSLKVNRTLFKRV